MQSPTCIMVKNVSQLCGGVVGLSGKFCIRGESCPINSHRRNKFADLKPGFWLKASDTEAMTHPCVPLSALTEEAGRDFMTQIFSSTLETIRVMEVILDIASQQPGGVIADFSTVMNRKSVISKSIAMKTPAKPNRGEILRSKFQDLTQDLQPTSLLGVKTEKIEGLAVNVGEEELADVASQGASEFLQSPRAQFASKISNLFDIIIQSVMEEQANVNVLSDQVQDMIVQVGVKNDNLIDLPPTLWVAMQQLCDELTQVKVKLDEIEKKPSISAYRDDLRLVGGFVDQQALQKALSDFEQRKDRQSRLEIDALEADIAALRGDLDPLDEFLSIHHLATAYTEMKRDIANLTKQLNERPVNHTPLESTPSGIPRSPHTRKLSVQVGRRNFSNMSDFGAYMESILPHTMPFGAFLCVYSFMERVNSFDDVASATELKDMEVRKKLGLSAAEGIVVNSFKHALPKVFSHSSSDTSTSSNWLPGIPSKDKWEDEQRLSGAKITIKDNVEVIRERIESLIDELYFDHPEADALARQLLSDTISFVTALSRYITETFDNLKHAGFGASKSWKLVSKLVHRIFVTDCNLKRGMVKEVLDSENSRVLARGILWGIFATHQVMREYMTHGIENHPSISSEYVRFLVANSGLTAMDTMSSNVSKLLGDVKELSKSLKTVEKAATTASNKADQALTAAKNSKNK